MKNNLKGFSQVFSFTFRQQVRQRGYRLSLILITLLCFLLPAGIMAAVESGREETPTVAKSFQAETICVVDNTGGNGTDWSILNSTGLPGFTALRYVNESSLEAAKAAADGTTLIAVLDQDGEAYAAQILLPEETELTASDADSYAVFLQSTLRIILTAKAGLTQLPQVMAQVAVPDTEENGNGVMDLLGMLLPYLNIMVLYFLILLYGQGVANSVILEKTSKLMDFFLVTVKPAAMVLGKVLAMALAGLLQLFCYLVGLTAGFGAGTLIAKAIHPDTTMPLIQFFASFRLFSGMFSLPAVLLSVLLILAGFLLYCALAAIGGSLAGKPEDLSSTNILFVMALIVSFFCCLYSGGMSGMSSSADWLNYFPLTAILVTPSRVLIGQASLWTGVVSLVIVLAFALLLVLLAGKVYEMMSLYKGNPPSVQRMFRMLRERKKVNA
ncbi:MAG: ABC transporter permease [Clostridiales bacterium]|nr:ABC transporter permease [Clostridiales bacterium]